MITATRPLAVFFEVIQSRGDTKKQCPSYDG